MLRNELPAGLLVMTQQQWDKCSDDLLFVNLLQHQPAVVPAANAIRISHYHGLGLVKGLGAKRIFLGKTPKFIQ